MKAKVYNKYGNPDVLETAELPKPIAKKNEVVIKTISISLNQKDNLIRNGNFKLFTGSKFPKLIGSDFSGIIDSVGESVKDFKIGDEVFGYNDSVFGGVSAEYIVMPTKFLGIKPKEISHQIASTLGCVYSTALQTLRDECKIKQGDEILIYGASGGVGTAAMQIAKYYGAIVTAVAHSRNEEYCKNNGADYFVAYDKADAFLSDKKYHIFFQVFSKKNEYNRAKNILTPKGNFITLMIFPMLFIKNVFSMNKIITFMVRAKRADFEFNAELTKKKILNPFIAKFFDFDTIKEAYQLSENGSENGKIVVNIQK